MGKHAIEFAIVRAIPGVYHTGISMIASGDLDQAIPGALMLLGITSMFLYGVGKIVAKVIWRQSILN